MRTALTLILAVLLAISAANAAESVGFVAASRGDAQVNEQAARVGMEVFEGDKLVTGEKSRLKVLFSDDVVLALGSRTAVVVEKHLFDPKSGARRTRLNLLEGKLRSLVQKMVAGSRADFEVKTTNAVAGVRGTEFILVAEEEGTKLYTFSGEVELVGSGEPVLVAAGQGSDVGEEGQAKKPEAVAAAVLKDLRQATDTEQSPEAVAWNLQVDEKDRLVAGAGGVETAEEGELDQEAMESGSQGRDVPDPKIIPCPDCQNWDEGVATAGGSFNGNDVRDDIGGQSGPLEGSWNNSHNGIDFDAGVASPLNLRITIHRENRR
jgi:hypothetical protein